MTIKLYSGPLSLFSRKVEIALGEKGLAFDRIMVPFSQAEGYSPKHPDVLSANPKAQVPVLVDGGFTLFDSTLIFEYLEDAYPDPPLYPRDARGRAQCRMVELTADEILLPMVARLMYRTEPPNPDPMAQRLKEKDGVKAEHEIGLLYKSLDGLLAGQDYFCGAFSVADIAVFMSMLFARRLDGPSWAPQAELSAWFDRMESRPAVGKAAAEVATADRELSSI